jgi:hypothetical protein
VRAVLAQMPRVASARFARRKRDAGYLHAQAVS